MSTPTPRSTPTRLPPLRNRTAGTRTRQAHLRIRIDHASPAGGGDSGAGTAGLPARDHAADLHGFARGRDVEIRLSPTEATRRLADVMRGRFDPSRTGRGPRRLHREPLVRSLHRQPSQGAGRSAPDRAGCGRGPTLAGRASRCSRRDGLPAAGRPVASPTRSSSARSRRDHPVAIESARGVAGHGEAIWRSAGDRADAAGREERENGGQPETRRRPRRNGVR